MSQVHISYAWIPRVHLRLMFLYNTCTYFIQRFSCNAHCYPLKCTQQENIELWQAGRKLHKDLPSSSSLLQTTLFVSSRPQRGEGGGTDCGRSPLSFSDEFLYHLHPVNHKGPLRTASTRSHQMLCLQLNLWICNTGGPTTWELQWRRMGEHDLPADGLQRQSGRGNSLYLATFRESSGEAEDLLGGGKLTLSWFLEWEETGEQFPWGWRGWRASCMCGKLAVFLWEGWKVALEREPTP